MLSMRRLAPLLAALALSSLAAGELIQFVNECAVPVEAAFIYTRPAAGGATPQECPGLRVSPSDANL